MTVNVLFCEGQQGKYDVRLLQVLLVGTGCDPIPAGMRINLSTGVRMTRSIRRTGGQGIFALRDRRLSWILYRCPNCPGFVTSTGGFEKRFFALPNSKSM